MIIIRNSKGSASFNGLPLSAKQAYADVPELIGYIDGVMAGQGEYVFPSWQQVFTFALKQLLQSKPSQLVFTAWSVDPSSALEPRTQFLKFMVGKLYWASAPVVKESRERFPSAKHMIPAFIYRRAKVGAMVNSHYNFFNKATPTDIFSPLLALLLGCSDPVKLEAYRKLKTEHHSMNCEEFIVYSLLCTGELSYLSLKNLMQICRQAQSYQPLYNFLGFDVAHDVGTVDDISAFTESQILFEVGKTGEISHLLLYNHEDKNVYELAFGKEEIDFRVIATEGWAYIDSPLERGKILKATPLSTILAKECIDQDSTHKPRT